MRLYGIFKDNMVFQRDKAMYVFGNGAKGPVNASVCFEDSVLSSGESSVSSDFSDSLNSSDTSDDGRFTVELPALPAGGPYTLEVTDGESSAVIRNVYIGEVWIAGGQSNMEYPLGRADHASKIVPDLPVTNIHFYQVPVAAGRDDLTSLEEETSWNIINKDNCYGMSGVAFFFIRKVEEYLKSKGETDLHFGVIGCYLGGTSVSSWQSADSLGNTYEGRRFIDEYLDKCSVWSSHEEYLAAETKFADDCEDYANRVNAELNKSPYLTYLEMDNIIGGGPWPPPVSPVSIRRPGALFEGMVLRLVPLSSRGVIFYQGEEDTASHSEDYAVAFKTMIEEWRSLFLDEDLPFLFCELPQFPLTSGDTVSEDPSWQRLRGQQKLVADTVPNAYMAEFRECGEVDNVHPSDKKTPGERLADLAIRFVYG